MKIALILGTWGKPALINAYEALNTREGVEITLFLSNNIVLKTSLSTHRSIYLEDLGEYHLLWSLPRIFQLFHVPYQIPLTNIAKYLKRFDLLISHENFTYISYLSARISRKYDIPFIFQQHENIPYPPYQRNPLTKYIKKYTTNAAKKVFAVTPVSKKALVEEGCNPEKIKIIPLSVDTNLFHPIKKEEAIKYLGVEEAGIEDSFNFLFAGRLEYAKGINWLIKTFSELKKDPANDNMKLLLAGESYLPKKINRLIEKREEIYYFGHIPYEKMPYVYNLCDVLVLPSIPHRNNMEQFGAALIEAMACSKPVISTNVGGIPFVADNQKTGILVSPRDTKSLSSVMQKIYADRELYEKFKKNARTYVIKKFSTDVVAELILKEIEGLI
jgi:glycosyltransferase involved in cell wall biosynthesis